MSPDPSPDAPASTVDPFVNLYAMLTRQTHRGTVLGTGQRVTLAEAVQGCRRAGTDMRLAEGNRDTLAIGMQADIAGVGLHQFARDRMQVVGVGGDLIPNPIDQNRCAQSRSPMDMMRPG